MSDLLHRFKGDKALCGETEAPVYMTPHDDRVTCPECLRLISERNPYRALPPTATTDGGESGE